MRTSSIKPWKASLILSFPIVSAFVEVMIDPLMNLWDAAPLLPIITEAGGHFGDWSGNPTIRAGEALATNGHVRDEVLAIVRAG